MTVLFSSCASIFNQPSCTTSLMTKEPARVVIGTDTMEIENNLIEIPFLRKKESEKITILTDSVTKRITLLSKNSAAYWSNIYFNWGIGMLVERKKDKRYMYPRNIYVNTNNKDDKYYGYNPFDKKGTIRLHLSMPWLNNFNFTPNRERSKINTGFMGLSAGLDYFHSPNQFVQLTGSGIIDFIIPFPASVTKGGEWENMRSSYISISNNHAIDRFSLGYGLSFSRNTWIFNDYDRFDPTHEDRSIKKSSNAIGFVFNSYFQTSKHFHVGAIYRPSFFRTNVHEVLRYEHIISLDLAWKFILKRSYQ